MVLLDKYILSKYTQTIELNISNILSHERDRRNNERSALNETADIDTLFNLDLKRFKLKFLGKRLDKVMFLYAKLLLNTCSRPVRKSDVH